MQKHKFPYNWRLSEAKFTKDKGKVFSCFACGGGSTMGYKLAGFDVIGCNEIDAKVNRCYVANHSPLELREQGDIALSEAYKKLTGKRGFFNQQFCYEDRVCYTLSAHLDSLIPFKQPVYLSTSEVCNISTFPQDYNFCGLSPHYICGMSVPPVMMAQIATRIYEQWLSKL